MAKAKQETGFIFPSTVSREELLIDGDDRRLRRLLYELTALATRVEKMREQFAARLDLTSPQYNILFFIGQSQTSDGLTVTTIADAMMVSKTHVTKEVKSLVALGLLNKRDNPTDGRSILVKLSKQGESKINGISDILCKVNDSIFRSLTRKQFLEIAKSTEVILNDAERTLRLFPHYMELK